MIKYVKSRNVTNQFDNRFTSIPWCPGLHCVSTPFNALKSGTWQVQEIHGIIRTLAVNCAQIPVHFKNDWKTVAETGSDKIAMGAVRGFCEFSLRVSQQNHSDLSLNALDDALKQSIRTMVIFKNRQSGSLWRPKWMNRWQGNPFSYRNKRFWWFVLQWRFLCMGLKRFPQQNVGNFRFAWREPDKWEPNGQKLIVRRQSSNSSTRSIHWHLLNASIAINVSNFVSDNHWKQSALR